MAEKKKSFLDSKAAAGAGFGAIAGLLKSEFADRPKRERQQELAAATTRLSPFTGLKAGPIREVDPLGQAMQFGFSGLATGQSLDQNEQHDALMKSYIDALKTQKEGGLVKPNTPASGPKGVAALTQRAQVAPAAGPQGVAALAGDSKFGGAQRSGAGLFPSPTGFLPQQGAPVQPPISSEEQRRRRFDELIKRGGL